MAEASIRTFVYPFNPGGPNGTTSPELHCYTRVLNDGTRYATQVLSRQQILHIFRRLSFSLHTSILIHRRHLYHISQVRIIWLLWRTCAPSHRRSANPSLRQNMDDRTLWRSRGLVTSIFKGSICHRPHSGLLLNPPSSTEHVRSVVSSCTNDATRSIS
jgi:hypothetical protein